MAYSLFHLLSLLIFLSVSALAQTNGTSIAVGSYLTAASDATGWLSPSGDFAFGFQKVKGSDLFLLSIWFDKIPDKTIVWFPNEATPVPSGSRVELTAGRGLVLTDPQRVELWSSRPVPNQVAYGIMNDTGNFQIVRSDSFRIIWSTFQNPSDTMLPTQIMERDVVLYSRMAETNFSRGRFKFCFQLDGNLVFYTRDVVSGFQYSAYYSSATNDASNSSNAGSQVVFNETGYMYILRANGQRLDLNPRRELQAADNYFRATLNFDGVFILYYHPRSFTGNPNWTAVWWEPANICLAVREIEGSGVCGYNSVCTLQLDQGRPKCECPPMYSLIDSNNTYGGCKPSFTQSCDEDVQGPQGNLNDYVQLIDTDWPTSDYSHMDPVSEEECKSSCLTDCFCAIAIYRRSSCWKKKLPLSNGRKDRYVDGKAFLKYRKDFTPTITYNPPSTMKKENGTGLIVGVFVPFAFVSFLTALALYCFIQRRPRQDTFSDEELMGMVARPYTFGYAELRDSTNNFLPENKLGEGGFGSVYKGTLADGRIIAVKQLSVASHHGKSQFVAEIATISAVQHRNLVILHGCYIQADKRLLVYEYMENKSLDQALFGSRSVYLEWPKRFEICLGVARGLAYLHEESRLRIVHRDVKASNILLDSNLNPKISDFGLAKLYDDKKTHMSTRVAGTIGYLAPEYAMRGHLTEKADVFGFGVVALEIVSGRPNSDSTLEDEKIYLLEWAWNLHESNFEVEMVDESLSEFDEIEVKRVIRVALACTQTSPTLRPSMSRALAMLSGDIEVSKVTSRPAYLADWKFNDVTTFINSVTSTSLSGTDHYTSGEGTGSGFDTHPASPGNATVPMLHRIASEGKQGMLKSIKRSKC